MVDAVITDALRPPIDRRQGGPSQQAIDLAHMQFQGAELIAEKWGITRDGLDRFGLESQRRAAAASAADVFAGQACSVDAPVLGERDGGRRALIPMCCSGGLGTGTILEGV